MRSRKKSLNSPGKLLILLIIAAAALAIFSVSAYAQYHSKVVIVGRVNHGTEPVWGAIVTANTTSDQGTPTGSGSAVTDYTGFYQITLDNLNPAAGYVELTATYRDYRGVDYRGTAAERLSSGTLAVNILLTNESERAPPVTATPAPTPTAAPTPAPSATPAAPSGSPGGCCGLFILLPVSIVGLAAGRGMRRQKK